MSYRHYRHYLDELDYELLGETQAGGFQQQATRALGAYHHDTGLYPNVPAQIPVLNYGGSVANNQYFNTAVQVRGVLQCV